MAFDPEQFARFERELTALTGSHRYDLIMDVASKMLAMSPYNGTALYALAAAQYGRACQTHADEDFARMRETIERALQSYPNVPEFYHMLYLYYLWYGGEQYVLARDCLLAAIELRPDHADFYRSLGEIYLINREADKAVKHLSKAVELAPNRAEYRSRLALGLLRQHKVDESVAMAEQALHDAPDDMQVLDTVGMIYILLGDLDKANKFFRDAISRDPNYNYFQQHMEWIKRELRDREQRTRQRRKYTPLYIRQKGSKRFFDEEAGDAASVPNVVPN